MDGAEDAFNTVKQFGKDAFDTVKQGVKDGVSALDGVVNPKNETTAKPNNVTNKKTNGANMVQLSSIGLFITVLAIFNR